MADDYGVSNIYSLAIILRFPIFRLVWFADNLVVLKTLNYCP